MADLTQPIPLDQIANVGSIATIEEMSPSTPGGKPRKIVLVGGALPAMGQANWTSATKLVTTWYPGNDAEASQQVIGGMEGPSQWSGEWNRTRMGRAPSYYFDELGQQRLVIDPKFLWDALELIRAGGARLRVTWAVRGRELSGSVEDGNDVEVDFQVVREGRIKQIDVKPDRATDFHWQIDFEWMSRGRRQARVASVRSDEDLALAASATGSSIDALDDLVNAKIVSALSDDRLSATRLTLGQLESMAGAPLLATNRMLSKLRYNVGQFRRVGNIARKLATTPAAVANSTIDFARNTAAVANQFVDELGRVPAELLPKRQKVSDMARAAKYFGRIADGVRKAGNGGTELDRRLRQVLVTGANRGTLTVRESATTRAGDLIAIHVCKAGDTPQKVSRKYYGNADQGEPLLRANRLPLHTPVFRPGSILIVPALANAPRST